MALSNDLVSQFAKISKNDSAKTDKSIYGTVVEVNGEKFVKFDGSDLLTPTPVKYTTDISDEDRVIVTVKNHTATVTGNLTAPSAKLDDLIKALNLEGEVAGVKNLIAEKIVASEIAVGDLVADNVTINEKLTANEASIGTLEADNAVINDTLVANKAAIGDLEAENATINGVLTANTADIEDLKAKTAEIENLDAKYANIDFANIGEAAIEKMYATTGLIKNLTVENGQIVTGELDVVKINGDLINANTIKADKLVVRGNDGLYYQLNLDSNGKAPVGVSEVDLQNGLHGTKIIADSITADKISVSDLTAFGATIAGFTIVDEEDAPGKLYSGVKESIDNTTAGVYMDSDGQILFGDTTNYVKFFKNEDGTYSLDISASTIKLGGTGKTVEAVIDEKVDSAVGDNVDAAVNDALSDISIGGRNLLLYTKALTLTFVNTVDSWYVPATYVDYVTNSANNGFGQIDFNVDDSSVTEAYCFSPLNVLPSGWQGRKLTISAMVYSDDWSTLNEKSTFRVMLSNSSRSRNATRYFDDTFIDIGGALGANAASGSETPVNGKWTKFQHTIELTDEYFTNGTADLDTCTHIFSGFYLADNGRFSIKMPKLEFGTIATDWSPAPEDTDDAIDNAQSDIDNLVIGARNLLRYTNVSSYWDKWTASPENDTAPTLELVDEYLKITPHVDATSAGAFPPNTANFKKGVTYTISFMAYADAATSLNNLNFTGDTAQATIMVNIPISTTPKKYTYTFSMIDNFTNCSVCISQYNSAGSLVPFYIKDLMLEQGTRATDWTPAPEDVVEELTGVQNTADSALHSAEINTSRLNSAELSIDAINATIQSLVTGANGETLMTQTDSGWTFNISSIQNTLSTAVKDIDELDSETSSEIENLKSSVSELGVYTEYIEFGVEKDADGNSQPAIILGEHDSNFKVVITNTDIRFMEGTTMPANISNQSLNIEKAVIGSELKQGGFVWMARENGNYGLVWKGE